MRVAVHKDVIRVKQALWEMCGLSVDDFTTPVSAGHLAFVSCSPNDAPTYPGTAGWDLTLRTLRETLIPKGFEKSDKGNLSLAYHPKKKIALLVATGDDDTGKEGGHPKTKNPKGSRTHSAVEHNNEQLALFPPESLPHQITAKNKLLPDEY